MRLLHELITRIKEEEERDINNKNQARREAASFMQALREQMGAEAENEAELERLWQMENEKEWAKKEARYKAEQEARDRLLKEVWRWKYHTREQMTMCRDILAVGRSNICIVSGVRGTPPSVGAPPSYAAGQQGGAAQGEGAHAGRNGGPYSHRTRTYQAAAWNGSAAARPPAHTDSREGRRGA